MEKVDVDMILEAKDRAQLALYQAIERLAKTSESIADVGAAMKVILDYETSLSSIARMPAAVG